VFRFSSSEHDNEYGGSPQGHSFHSMDPTVRRCRLMVFKPVLKAPLGAALEAKML